MKKIWIRALSLVMLCCFYVSIFQFNSLIACAGKFEGDCKIAESSIKGEYVQGQALVSFKNKSSMEKWRKENAAMSLKREFNSGENNQDGLFIQLDNQERVITLVESNKFSTPEIMASLRNDRNVLYVEPNYTEKIASIDSAPDVPFFKYQWGLDNLGGKLLGEAGNDINVDALWSKGITGSDDVVVAVLDTGIDYEHPDLAGNMWKNENPSLPGTCGYNFADKNDDPMDKNGHGTHCAGIIGADGTNHQGVTGVNQKIKLMALRASTEDGRFSTSTILAAYDYMIKAKKLGVNLRVVNNSWGGGRYSLLLRDLVEALGKLGVESIFAAGNDAEDMERYESAPLGIENSPYRISVAATNTREELAGFSNYGRNSVDVAAPGQGILSTFPRSESKYHPELAPDGNEVYQKFENKDINYGPIIFRPTEDARKNQLTKITDARAVDGENCLSCRPVGADCNIVKLVSDPIKLDPNVKDERFLSLNISSDELSVAAFQIYVLNKDGEWSNIVGNAVEDSWSKITASLDSGLDVDWEHFSIKIVAVIKDTMPIKEILQQIINGNIDIGYQGEEIEETEEISEEESNNNEENTVEKEQANQIEELNLSAGIYIDAVGVGSKKIPYEYLSGTSMAAPMITGSYALMCAYNKDWSCEEMKARIVGGTVRNSPDLQYKTISDGRFDIGVAVSAPHPVLNKAENINGVATIDGYFFGDNGKVFIDDIECKIINFSDQQIKIELPEDKRTGKHSFVVETDDERSGRADFKVGALENEFKTLAPLDQSITKGAVSYGDLIGCNNKIYNMGARVEDQSDEDCVNQYVNSMYCYDIATNEWSEKAFPEKISARSGGVSCCTIGNDIWTFLPMVDEVQEQSNKKDVEDAEEEEKCTYKVWVYSTEEDTWTMQSIKDQKGNEFDFSDIKKSCIQYYRGNIWFVGDGTRQVWKLDPYTNKIEKDGRLPRNVLGLALQVASDEMILVGVNPAAQITDPKKIYIYDGNSWVKGTNFLDVDEDQSFSLTIGATNDGLIATGMLDKDNNDTYVYHSATNKWEVSDRKLDSDKVFKLTGTTYNDVFYVMGIDINTGKSLFKCLDLTK